MAVRQNEGMITSLDQVDGLAEVSPAVRQVLDYQTTGKAVIVCLVGWVAYMVVVFLLVAVFGISAALT